MINTRQIDVNRDDASANYGTLYEYLRRRKVMRMPFLEVQKVVVGSVQHVLIDSTTHLPGAVLAVMDATPPVCITNAGVVAAELVGVIGTAAVTNYKDSLGNILNLITIHDSATHDKLLTPDGRTIYGLVQCANGVVDGAAVGANGAENTQISFVYIAADETVTLITAGWIATTIEFQINKMYMELRVPSIYLEGGNQDPIVIEPPIMEPDCRKFVVTAAFASGEVLTLATGGGAASGTSDPTGDDVTLDSSEALFNNNNGNRIRLNGVQLIRDVEVEWVSTTTLKINYIMDVDDVLEVEVPNYT